MTLEAVRGFAQAQYDQLQPPAPPADAWDAYTAYCDDVSADGAIPMEFADWLDMQREEWESEEADRKLAYNKENPDD